MTVVPPHVRVVRFFEQRPWLGDLLFKVLPLSFLAWTFWGTSTGYYENEAYAVGFLGSTVNRALMLTLEMIVIAPLVISRIRPGLAATVMAVGAVLQIVTLSGPGFSVIAVPLAVYSCAKYGTRRVSRTFLLVGLGGAVLVGLFGLVEQFRFAENPAAPGFTLDVAWMAVMVTFITLFAAAVVLVAWLLGDLSGRRRREVEAVAEKNRLLEVERDQEARMAAAAERMRIAREMHDVISHSMSVMIAQADGGRYVLNQDPQRAGEAFETIGETGREALSQMRRMLGVLREEHEELARRPAPGVQDLDQLVADVQASGLPVTLHMAPHLPSLQESVGLAVYRIVQEALTNTLKHGGPDAQAQVWLGVDSDSEDLVVEIRDSGQGAQADNDGAGSGLLGMTERAQLYGGTLEVHRPERGFAVTARFPFSAVFSSRSGSDTVKTSPVKGSTA